MLPGRIFTLCARISVVGVPDVKIADQSRDVELPRTWHAIPAAGTAVFDLSFVFSRDFVDYGEFFPAQFQKIPGGKNADVLIELFEGTTQIGRASCRERV